jgi:hypothetical protein
MKLNIFTMLALSGFALSSVAADVNVDQEAKAPGDPLMTNMTLIRQLTDVGLEQKDPLMLMTAAKLYAITPTQDTKRTKESEGGRNSTKDSELVIDLDSLLDYAKDYSGDNEIYLAMISEIESVKTRGRASGPAVTTDRVNAGATDTYRVTYRGNELAEILIIGDGDTDLDLYVYDENGNDICTDDDYTDQMYCSWVPSWTGEFTIRIKNRGDVYNVYDFLTN